MRGHECRLGVNPSLVNTAKIECIIRLYSHLKHMRQSTFSWKGNMRRITLVVALVLGCWLPATAQIQGGGITGIVTDQQGGVLPGATATLQGVDATRSFVTDASGTFRFLDLAPGPYKLTIALNGFRTLVREGLIMEVGKNVDLPISLPIGLKEVVTVTAATPLVDRK